MIVGESDVLIDFLRSRGEGARRVATELQTGSFATTAITWPGTDLHGDVPASRAARSSNTRVLHIVGHHRAC